MVKKRISFLFFVSALMKGFVLLYKNNAYSCHLNWESCKGGKRTQHSRFLAVPLLNGSSTFTMEFSLDIGRTMAVGDGFPCLSKFLV